MRRFKRWFRERRWIATHGPADERPYFEATHCFQAADQDEAEALWEKMTEALGCSEKCADEQCPHFRVGSLRLLEDDE